MINKWLLSFSTKIIFLNEFGNSSSVLGSGRFFLVSELIPGIKDEYEWSISKYLEAFKNIVNYLKVL